MKREIDLIMDSGAYSAWRKQEEISVKDYIKFLDRHKDCLHGFVNLDVIPGKWGTVASPAEIEETAKAGWKNLIALRKAGHEAMPVYHMGERLYWLEKMIGEGFTYVGISPANDRHSKEKIEWLDEIFGFLCSDRGYPTIKTHGFGVTAVPILFRYPWFSADSITWMLIPAYGGILVPAHNPHGDEYDKSTYDYSTSPTVLKISSRPREGLAAMDSAWSGHYASMGPRMKEFVDDYLKGEGLTPEQMAKDYYGRMHQCAKYFSKVTERCTPKPFFQKRSGFFNAKTETIHGQTKPVEPHFKHIFTVNLTPIHSGILQEYGIRDRLLTYFYFKERDPFDIHDYVKTGIITMAKQGKKRKKKAVAA